MKNQHLGNKILRKWNLYFIPSAQNHYRPLFFEGRCLLYVLLGLLILKLAIIPFSLYLPTSSFFAEVTKTALFNSTNEERLTRGLAPLKDNIKLDQAAHAKALNMLQEGYFNHVNPEGLSPWYWFRRQGYQYQYAGENLAIGFLNSNEVTRAWMKSPGHRENILNPHYQEMGLAVVKGNFQGQETTLVVQLFGKQIITTTSAATKTEPFTPPSTPTSSKSSLSKVVNKVQGEQATETVAPSERTSVPASPYRSPGPTNVSVLPATRNPQIILSLFEFLNQNYEKGIKIAILTFLALVGLAIFLMIIIRIEQQSPDLIAKGSLAVIILVSFLLLEEGTLLRIIPHNLLIC